MRRDRVEEERGRQRAEATAPPEAARPAGVADVITDLQRRAGNRAVSRLLSRQTGAFSRVDLGTAVADEPDLFARFDLQLAQAEAPSATAPAPADPNVIERFDLGGTAAASPAAADPDVFARFDLGGPAPAPAAPASPAAAPSPAAGLRFRRFSIPVGQAPPAVAPPAAPAPAPAVPAPAVATPPARPAGPTPALPPRRPATPAPAAAPGPRRPRAAAPGGLAGPQTRAVADTRAYAAIRRTLADYERERKGAAPGTEDRQAQLLARLDELCTAWLNGHRTALGPQDAARWTVVGELAQRVAEERSKLSQTQAHEVYMESLTAGQEDVYDKMFFGGQAPAVPDTYAHKFQAASPKARLLGVDARSGFRSRQKKLAPGQADPYQARLDLVREKGLTPAEHAALMAFTTTAGDYNYINPAQVTQPTYDPVTGAKQKSWMEANRERAAKPGEDNSWKGIDPTIAREEGALHAALAVSGMKKLDPFEGVSYRGETTDAMTVVAGAPKVFHSLTSTSKDPNVPTSFVATNLSPARNVAVFWLFDHKGGHLPGRDIEILSSAGTGEAEVALFPGSRFTVADVAIGRPVNGKIVMEQGAIPAAFAFDFPPTHAVMGAAQIVFITAKMLPARPGTGLRRPRR